MDRKMIDYLPEIMKGVKEFIQMADTEQGAKEKLWEDVYRMFDEGYISTETVIGLRRWEKTLGITPKDTDSIDVRTFRVRARLLRDLPYTYRTLKKMLNSICGEDGYTINLYPDEYRLKVRVELKCKQYKSEMAELMEEIVPAHIILDVDLRYNTHRMLHDFGLSNRELQQYVHSQIKDTDLSGTSGRLVGKGG
jgi:hypothetical protein